MSWAHAVGPHLRTYHMNIQNTYSEWDMADLLNRLTDVEGGKEAAN